MACLHTPIKGPQPEVVIRSRRLVLPRNTATWSTPNTFRKNLLFFRKRVQNRAGDMRYRF